MMTNETQSKPGLDAAQIKTQLFRASINSELGKLTDAQIERVLSFIDSLTTGTGAE